MHSVKNGALWDNWKNINNAMGISDKDAYRTYVSMSGIPIVGDFIRASDNIRAMDDYMGNRGLSYSDVQYPTRTVGSGYGSATSGLISLSKTVSKLY